MKQTVLFYTGKRNIPEKISFPDPMVLILVLEFETNLKTIFP